ncbi:MAG: 5-formyltetrahydrofolate cyclo-ligase [Sedimenticolaceae bacterium]
MTDQQRLRQHLKHTRLALSAQARAEAAASAARLILKHPRVVRAKRVAAYFGIKGELSPMGLMEHAAQSNKQCFLPVLHPFLSGRLWFCRWRPGDRVAPNRFGIPEPIPRAGDLVAARNLDLVIVPLLGFDSDCHRLGMGGGYYDRSFAFIRRLKHRTHPYLIGFAHESQRVDRLQTQAWDITLDAIASDRRFYFARR